MRRIADGFDLAEGPVVRFGTTLLVADVMAGGIRRFDASGTELPLLIDRRRGIGGVAVLGDGSVIVGGRDLSTVADDGTVTTLADLEPGGTGYNDLAVTPTDGILAGLLTCHPLAGGDLTPGRLVLLDRNGGREVSTTEFSWPNGIGFSSTGHRVFVADFDRGVVHRGEWNGALADLVLRPWFVSPSGDADGLAVGDDDHVWLASGSGGSILHVDPDGGLVEELAVPDDFVSSCCLWPETDRLVITTGTGVFFHEFDTGRG